MRLLKFNFASTLFSMTAGIIALVLVLGACNKIEPVSPPNIVFVFADDLGWTDLGYNGQSFYETPNIDKLSEDGMVFNRFYPGAANCAPSRACLLTGMFTPRHGVYVPQGLSRNGAISKMRYKTPTKDADSSFFNFHVSINNVESKYESLAEMLGRAGYTSARFGKWHIGDDNQGFDVSSANGEPGFITNLEGNEQRFYNDTLVAQKLTSAGIDFITENKDNPFFLYLAHWEVHGPMAATRDRIDYFRKKKEKNGVEGMSPVYAAEVEQLDLCVGRIVTHLEELGLAENTILIFTSDNGGVIPTTTNIPLRAGKGTFYEGGIRTAFCIKWPGMIEPGRVSDIPVYGVDMMPTFAELANVPVPENQPVDGSSILPVLTGGDFDSNRSMFFHFPLYLGGGGKVMPSFDGEENYWRAVPLSVIMKGDWKLIKYYEYDSYELFNLKDDISEVNDLSEVEKEKAEELLLELREWTDETNAPIPHVLNTTENSE